MPRRSTADSRLASACRPIGVPFLGSLSWHPWAADVSVLSAPWLVLPFLAGATQRDPRRAALLGLGSTASALIGYGLMTLSPVENAQLTVDSLAAFVRSESPWIVSGLLTGRCSFGSDSGGVHTLPGSARSPRPPLSA